MTYVNIGICSADDAEKIDLGIEPSTDGEFLFIKIKSCKGYNGTVIVGNVYRSPSRKIVRLSSSYMKTFLVKYTDIIINW